MVTEILPSSEYFLEDSNNGILSRVLIHRARQSLLPMAVTWAAVPEPWRLSLQAETSGTLSPSGPQLHPQAEGQ